MSAAELLALLDSDPAAGILAAADLREQRAGLMPSGPYQVREFGHATGRTHYVRPVKDSCLILMDTMWPAHAEHIAAEANPAHALAAVRRWRLTVQWWRSMAIPDPHGLEENGCDDCLLWQATADEARAYLGGAT